MKKGVDKTPISCYNVYRKKRKGNTTMKTTYEIEFINSYEANRNFYGNKEEAIKWAKIYRNNGIAIRLLEIVATEMEF